MYGMIGKTDENVSKLFPFNTVILLWLCLL